MTDAGTIDGAIGRTLAGFALADAAIVYVGYSGGLDSTVLLHAVQRLLKQRVIAVHVNHGLHADAGKWQRHCTAACNDLQVELLSRRVATSAGNLEAAARVARYAYFEEVLGNEDVLLLAHHQDDQAETVLLRIAQGRGLIGMPEARSLGRGRLLRPLLKLPRSELEDYARHWQLRWVEDPSNADVDMDRNYLRARVTPVLRARWPDFGGAIEAALAQRLSVDEILLAGLDPATGWLAISDLQGASTAAAAEHLRVWLLARHAVAPSGRALQSFVGQLDAAADRQPELKLNIGALRRYRGRIYHVFEPPRLQARYRLDRPGSLHLPHGVLEVARSSRGAGFATTGALYVVFRHHRDGCDDALRLRGHRRDLNKLLQEAEVPPWERGFHPLLMDELGIVAVPGVAYRDTHPELESALWEANWTPYVR